MAADEAPAGGAMFEQAGEAEAAGGAANGIEIDDGKAAIVGELRKGEAVDQLFFDGGC